MIKNLSALALAAACLAPAGAQTVYRCGDAYSQRPCAGAVVLQTDDTRATAQEAAARRAATAREAKLADAMEKARLKEEAKPARVVILPVRSAASAPAAEQKLVMTKPGKQQHFTAVAPGKPGEEKKKKSKKASA